MTQGLVRKNNLSDLPSPEQARANLGLATADYERIRGLYTSAGVSNIDVQYIAGSTSNYQQQISSINSTISGIPSSIYVSKSGGTISGEWNNVGAMGAASVLISGSTISGSSDALFASDFAGGQFRITTATLVANSGLTVQRFVSSGNVVTATGVMIDTEIPIMINGAPFFIEAGSWPSLDLRFAETKSLNDVITGQNLVSFTRASTGTYTDSAGVLQTAAVDAPRFDHNPTTGESLGLLVEEQRTNLLTGSEAFDVSPWTKNNGCTITSDATASPTGTLTADQFNGTAISFTGVFAFPTTVPGAVYTFSIYIKNNSNATSLRLGVESNPTNAFVTFNAVTGTITSVAANVTSSSAQFVGNGWYRVVLAYTTTGTSAGLVIYSTSGAVATWFAWGAQLEAGAFPTSYIATTSAATTRSADVASITGSNFSSWYRQDEGTVFCDARTQQSAAGHILAGVSTGSFSGSAYLSKESDNLLNGAPNAAPSNLSILLSSVSSNVGLRAALAFTAGTGSASAVMNGGTVGTDSSTGIPITMTQMGIGTAPWSMGTALWNGTIRRLVYWGQRLPNNVLQAITQ